MPRLLLAGSIFVIGVRCNAPTTALEKWNTKPRRGQENLLLITTIMLEVPMRATTAPGITAGQATY
jgi:hypothetical protein